jgi:hypothetical protein
VHKFCTKCYTTKAYFCSGNRDLQCTSDESSCIQEDVATVGINGGDSEDTRDSFDTPPRKSKKAKQSHSRDAARVVMTEGNETEGYKIRTASNSTALGEDLIYPNDWDLGTGDPTEKWQRILAYLQERYGEAKNKTVKETPYAEDIHNMRLVVKRHPDLQAPAYWLQKLLENKVKRSKAKQSPGVSTLLPDCSSDQHISDQDQSFLRNELSKDLSSVASSFADTINTGTAAHIYHFVSSLTPAEPTIDAPAILQLLKSRMDSVKDPDDILLLVNAAKVIGKCYDDLFKFSFSYTNR